MLSSLPCLTGELQANSDTGHAINTENSGQYRTSYSHQLLVTSSPHLDGLGTSCSVIKHLMSIKH